MLYREMSLILGSAVRKIILVRDPIPIAWRWACRLFMKESHDVTTSETHTIASGWHNLALFTTHRSDSDGEARFQETKSLKPDH